MEYAIRILELDKDNLLKINYMASKFPCDESEKDIKLNREKIEQLEIAIQRLRGEK